MDPPEKQHALPDTTGIDIQQRAPTTDEFTDSSYNKRHGRRQWMIVFIVVFVMCNILILYLLHFEHNAHPGASSTGSDILKTDISKSLVSTQGNSLGEGKVVSVDSTGKLTVGAGTAINLAVTDLTSAGGILNYLETAQLDPTEITDTILAAYYTMNTSYAGARSIITTATMQGGNITLKNNEVNAITGKKIRGIAPLTSTRAIVILQGPYKDSAMHSDILYAPASISSDGTVTVDQDKAYNKTSSSATNRIGRISSTQFAATYYEDYLTVADYHVMLTIGDVDSDGTISMTSTDLALGDGHATTTTTVSGPVSIKSGTDNAVAVAYWYTNNSITLPDGRNEHPAVTLCVVIAKKDGSSVTQLTKNCNERYKPNYFPAAIAISDTLFAIAIYNTEDNYAMTVILVEYSSGTIFFRSDVVVNSVGPGPFHFGTTSFYFFSEPKLSKLTDDRLAVVFHNSARDGLPSTAVLAVSSSGTLTLLTPPLPYAKDSFHMASTAANPTVITTLAIQGFTNGRYLTGFLGTLAGIDQRCFSLVQNRGPAIGVITDTGSTMNILTQGKYDPKNDVKVGYTYYSLMNGEIGGTNAVDGSVGYGAVRIGDTIISGDARLGVAVGENTLVLSPGVVAQAA